MSEEVNPKWVSAPYAISAGGTRKFVEDYIANLKARGRKHKLTVQMDEGDDSGSFYYEEID